MGPFEGPQSDPGWHRNYFFRASANGRHYNFHSARNVGDSRSDRSCTRCFDLCPDKSDYHYKYPSKSSCPSNSNYRSWA